MTKKEFPEKWYFKIDDENRDLVNDWRINIIKFADNICSYPYIVESGAGDYSTESSGRKGIVEFEITTSQFKEFVLNIQETLKLPDDLSHLERLLKEIINK